MNSKLYRLVFSRSRGALVAAAENVASSGKSGAGETSGGAGRRIGAGRGAAGHALTGLAFAAGSACGQALPTGASVQQGAAQVSSSGASMIVRQATPRLVTDWQSFSIGAGNSVQFVQPTSASVALNRVTGNQASTIFGSLSANGHVYLTNPAGVLFAPGSQVNVGALVASTLQADLNAFRAGDIRLSGGEAATGAVVNQGSIVTAAGGHVVLAGPQVGNAGSISTPQGTTALAAGNAVNVDPTGSGLLSITIPASAIGAHLSNTGSLSADGGLIALQAAATDAALRSVMQVGGVVRARSIEQRDGQIVLSGGASGVVAVTGTLDASGAAGADTRGGAVQVLGERVALLGNARIDASGDLGGGSVHVGGNFQGQGPLQNALDTHVGAGARIDASARRSGDGGTTIVWSDRHTDYRGHIEATGGRDGGNGGNAEVSGKQSLGFGGTVRLSAARGLTGTLLLDPDTIDIGLVSDIDGNGSTGDDILDSVTPSGSNFYNVDYADFAGAASRISASQLSTLLFDNQVTLKATTSILVSAPITVTPAASNRTLTLQAPSLTVNAPVDMGDGYLDLDTRLSFSDSIRINAPVKAFVVNLTSSDIGISAPVDVNTAYLNAAPSGSSVISSTGGLRADYVVVTKPLAGTSTVSLTGNNNIHYFQGDATTATVAVVAGDKNAGGFIIPEANVSGNFNLSVAGTSIYQFDVDLANEVDYGIHVGGQFNLTVTDPLAVRPQVFLQNGTNSFGSVVFDAPGNFFLDGSAGTLNVQGTAGGNITLLNTNQVTALTGDITSTGATGNTTVFILGVGFDNSANAQINVQPGSRFIINSRDYPQDVLGSNLAFGSGLGDINHVVFADYTGVTPSSGNVYSTNQSGTLSAPQSDLPGVSRVYDGTTSFSVTYAGASATGSLVEAQPETATRLSNDGAGPYTASGTGEFADKNVGVDKAYTTNPLTNTVLFGSSGVSYLGLVIDSFVRPAGPSAINPVSEVTPLAIALSGLTAADKVYDATTAATLLGTPTITPVIGDDLVVSGAGTGSFDTKNVGTAKPVTITGYTLGGADAGNYVFSAFPVLSADITPAPLAVTGIGALDKVYDTTTVATLTGSGAVSPLGSDVVTVGGSGTGNFDDKNVGTNKPVTVSGYTLGGADAGNYTVQQPSGVTASITPASLTLSGLTALDKVYDATTAATLAGTAVANPLAGDTVTLVGTGTGVFGDKDVGTAKPVTVTGYTLGGTDAGNYLLGPQLGLVADITPASLAVTGIGALDKVYDTTTLATLTGTGAITPFGSDVVTLGGSGSGAFNDKNVGVNKPVTVSGYTLGGADAGNYTVQQPSGVTASITPASLTLSGLTALDKVYDATTAATLAGTAVASPLAGDTVTLVGTATGSFSDKNVGTAIPVTVTGYTLGGADAGNYLLGTQPGLVADITPATLAVTGIVAFDKVYDTTTVTTLGGSGTVAALGSDVVTVGGSGTGNFDDKNVGTNKPVTVSGYTLGGADAGNYTVQQPSGVTASITPANLTLTGLTAADKVYDATTVATLGGTAVANPLAGDTVTLAGTGTGAFGDKNVGTAKPVTVTGYTLGGADAGNYVLGPQAGLVADITPAALAVTGIVALDKVYDTTTVATLSGSGAVAALGSDVVTVGGSGTGDFNDKNVGTNKPVTASGFTLGGADAGNYAVQQPSGLSASITPASLTLSGLTAADKVYDATTVATLTGTPAAQPLGNDIVGISGGSGVASFVDKNVGIAKPVTVSGFTLSGTDAGNYTLGLQTGLTASITPAPLLIGSFTVADKVYDGSTLASITGAAISTAPLAGDIVAISGGTASFADKNVGANKPVSASGFTLSGADAANYTVTASSPSSASITPRALSVGGLTALDKVYDSTPVAQIGGTPVLANVVANDVVALSNTSLGSFDDKNVGTAKPVTLASLTLFGTDAGNYTLTQPAGLSASITPYTLVASGVTAADKVYDTSLAAMLSGTPVLTPFPGDVIAFSAGATGSFDDKNVGLDKPVAFTAASLSGPDAGNYRLVAPGGGLAADITAKVLTPTGISAVPRGANASTDVTLDTSAAALSGVLPGDTVALVTSGASGSVSSPDAGTNKTVAVSGLDLTGPDARNYALSIGANGLPNNSVPLLIGITVTLFTPLREVFEDLRDKEYLQGVSDAQEPFRRAMTEALAAGFGKENIRKQLQRGLVFETGPAAPAVDTIAPARKPASCSPARGSNATPLSCSS